MAENVTLGSFATLQNSSIISTLNANNALIENAFADCLSLAGNQPNAMQSNLDMNSNQIINLPAPSTMNSPVRLSDVTSGVAVEFVLDSDFYVSPEQFGAVGNGVVDDTAAITAMANFGRSTGTLNFACTAGKTYTCTNPYVFSGIQYLTWEGEGCNWLNPRGTSAALNTFLVNYGGPVLNSGPFNGNGYNLFGNGFENQGYFPGTKINTALAGVTTITTIDGTAMPTGRILIFAQDRQGSDSSPPCTSCFEYNIVNSVVGATGTLAIPLQYDYLANAPTEWTTVAAKFTGGISSNVLTVSAVTSGTLAVGNNVDGQLVGTIPRILSQLTGTPGGIGTYSLNTTSTTVAPGSTLYCTTGNAFGNASFISLEDNVKYPGGMGISAVVNNVNFIDNVNFTNGFAPLINGSFTVQGIQNFVGNNIKCSAGGVSQTQYATLNNWIVGSPGGLSSNPQIEIDKMVDVFTANEGSVSQYTGGVGTKKVVLNDVNVFQEIQLAPLELLECNRGNYEVASGASNQLMPLFPGIGPRKSVYNNTRHILTNTANVRLFNPVNKSLVVDVAATSPTITCSQTNYATSGILKTIYKGAILRNSSGIPAFKVTKLPYCNSGDTIQGNVSIDGVFLATINIGDTLIAPSIWNTELNDPILDGAFFTNYSSVLGTLPGLTGPGVGVPFQFKIRDKYITDSSVRISSAMTNKVQSSNLYVMYLGLPFAVNQICIDVTNAAASASTLVLKYYDPTNAGPTTIYTSIDLTTTGVRIVDRSGATTLGGDSFAGALPSAPMQEIFWTDSSVALAPKAQYSVTFYGSWVGEYGT